MITVMIFMIVCICKMEEKHERMKRNVQGKMRKIHEVRKTKTNLL